jgi:hypothetical protein
MEFVEAPIFTQRLPDYLADDKYRELQLYLAGHPEAGNVMPGTGGFRKLRWTDQTTDYLVADALIWFFTLYDKDEAADLSVEEKRLLKTAIEEETRQRARRRRPRRS